MQQPVTLSALFNPDSVQWNKNSYMYDTHTIYVYNSISVMI